MLWCSCGTCQQVQLLLSLQACFPPMDSPHMQTTHWARRVLRVLLLALVLLLAQVLTCKPQHVQLPSRACTQQAGSRTHGACQQAYWVGRCATCDHVAPKQYLPEAMHLRCELCVIQPSGAGLGCCQP
jgi:hypothetical protein